MKPSFTEGPLIIGAIQAQRYPSFDKMSTAGSAKPELTAKHLLSKDHRTLKIGVKVSFEIFTAEKILAFKLVVEAYSEFRFEDSLDEGTVREAIFLNPFISPMLQRVYGRMEAIASSMGVSLKMPMVVQDPVEG